MCGLNFYESDVKWALRNWKEKRNKPNKPTDSDGYISFIVSIGLIGSLLKTLEKIHFNYHFFHINNRYKFVFKTVS